MVNNEHVWKYGCAKVHELIGQIVLDFNLGVFRLKMCVCVKVCVATNWCLKLKGPFAEQMAAVMPL